MALITKASDSKRMRTHLRAPATGAATKLVGVARRCSQVCKSVAAPPASASPTRPAATARDPGDFASVLGLVQWAVANKILFTGCRPDIRDGVRGVYVTSDCSAGENLVAVPLQASIAVQPDERCPFPTFLPQDVWIGLPWYGQLACKLLNERALGPASRFADYLPALPSHVDLPVLWPGEHVARLQYPYLQEQILDEQQEWARLYDRLRPHLTRRGLTRDDLHWALACVRSRTFAGPYFPTPAAVKLLAGAAGAVAAVAIRIALVGDAGLDLGGGAEAVALAVLPPVLAALGVPAAWQAAEARRAQSGDPGTVLYSVCPFIDMFNHDSRAQSECVYAPWRSEFRVAAGESYRRGQQILINYGSQSNDALLQRYGFVQLNGNPHDRYVLQDVRALMERVLERATGGRSPVAAEELRAAIRGLSPPPGSLDQVAVTAAGVPPETTQTVMSLLAVVASPQQQQQQQPGAPQSAEAVMAAAFSEELRAAATTLQEDEASLAQLADWQAWAAAEAARPASPGTDASGLGTATAASGERGGGVADEDAGRAAEGEGASATPRSEQGDVLTGEGVPEPQSAVEPILPPPELLALGDNVDRYRTVLMFRIAKKRVLQKLM